MESELPEEHEPWYKGPIKIIVGLFLLLIVVLWLVPYYGVKQNPEPQKIPTLKELKLNQFTVPQVNSTDIRSYIKTNSEIKQVADKIVSSSCSPTHRVCNAKALFYFVQKNFNYVNDPLKFEYFKTPQESFNARNGDCDDSSILVSSLLNSVGFQTRFVFVPQHVYVQVKIPEAVSSYKTKDGWINLDATCQSCQFGEISPNYANVQKRYIS